jgi:hypothetical protein
MSENVMLDVFEPKQEVTESIADWRKPGFSMDQYSWKLEVPKIVWWKWATVCDEPWPFLRLLAIGPEPVTFVSSF